MRRQYVLAYMETKKADFIETIRVNSGDLKPEGERRKAGVDGEFQAPLPPSCSMAGGAEFTYIPQSMKKRWVC